ncbi:MAG: hypothetical protein R3E48_20515 [Burkholderiaceae bacterium]
MPRPGVRVRPTTRQRRDFLQPRPAAAPNVLRDASDEDLMVLVARGFVQLATELFRRHNRALYNFIAWMARGDLREAEDVADGVDAGDDALRRLRAERDLPHLPVPDRAQCLLDQRTSAWDARGDVGGHGLMGADAEALAWDARRSADGVRRRQRVLPSSASMRS